MLGHSRSSIYTEIELDKLAEKGNIQTQPTNHHVHQIEQYDLSRRKASLL
jgi:hypothetical protein